MMSGRAIIGVAALGGVLVSGAAVAQTNVLPAAPPDGSTTRAPNGGLAQGVVPPPRNVDPGMVTPPPANVKPSMPVITPPASAK